MEDTVLLKIGDRGQLINKLQSFLKVENTGVFDRLTEAALKNYQAKVGAFPSGELNAELYSSIFKLEDERQERMNTAVLESITKTTELLKDFDSELHDLSILLKKYIQDVIAHQK